MNLPAQAVAARHGDPVTSHLAIAEHSLSGRRQLNCNLVARVLRGHGGGTYRELHAAHEQECRLDGRMPLEAVEFERRLNDLREDGRARDDSKKRCPISGKWAQTWFSLEAGICRVCGRAFTPRSSKHLHCSTACRLRKRPTASAWRIDTTHYGHALYFEGRAARDRALDQKACPYDRGASRATTLFGELDQRTRGARRDSRAWYWMAGWRDRQAEIAHEFLSRGQAPKRAPRGPAVRPDLPTEPGLYLFAWRHEGRRLTVEVHRHAGKLFALELGAKARAFAMGQDPGLGFELSRAVPGSIEWEPVVDPWGRS